MSRVSVIVPNYNHAKFLSQRLESIFEQAYTDFEVILLDDCSSDNSRDILVQYTDHPKVKTIVYNQQNSGSTFKQWEKGIEIATGEYIWIAETDDYCEPTFLEMLVSTLDKHPQAGIAYCQSISVDSENVASENWFSHTKRFSPNIWASSFLLNGQLAIQNILVHRNVIPNASAVVFRKSTYNSTSGINTEMTLNGDWLLWIKMLETSDMIFIANELNYFRQHGQKVTSRNMKNFNGFAEQLDLFRYIESNVRITKLQKQEMSYTFVRKWLHQVITGSIREGLTNIPRIYKQLQRFNKFSFIQILKVICSVIIGEFILRKQTKIDIRNIVVSPIV